MDPVADAIEDVDSTPVLRGRASAEALVVDAWERHRAEIHAFIARAVRDDDAAEDLLQETFVRLLSEARRGRPPGQLRPWLYRVASNLVISRGRRRSTVLRWLQRHGAAQVRSGAGASPESNFLEAERVREMELALSLLPADARVALLLSSTGFSGAEIAAAIGRTEGATRSMMTRSRIAVRSRLASEDAP
jgi:RNA polymerase sigma-70 factor (ECF subfamily)